MISECRNVLFEIVINLLYLTKPKRTMMMMISKIMKWNMMNYNQINQFCLIKNDNN